MSNKAQDHVSPMTFCEIVYADLLWMRKGYHHTWITRSAPLAPAILSFFPGPPSLALCKWFNPARLLTLHESLYSESWGKFSALEPNSPSCSCNRCAHVCMLGGKCSELDYTYRQQRGLEFIFSFCWKRQCRIWLAASAHCWLLILGKCLKLK